jgi:hypothetical protein
VNVEQYENILLDKRKKIIVGVAGSRRRDSRKDFDLLDSYVISLRRKAFKADADLEFVSGGCPVGADSFIKELCKIYKLPLVEHLPKEVEKHAQYYTRVQAFHARNALIALDCHFLIAMVAPDRTGGTENTIFHAEKYGKKVIII